MKMSNALFADLESSQYKAYPFDYDKTVNKDHGRLNPRMLDEFQILEICSILRGFSQLEKTC